MTTRAYTEHHPRWFRPPVSTYWWLERTSYFAFILRELSSVFVAWSVVFLLMLVRAVSQGEPAYREFLSWASGPGIVLLNVITFLFVMYHAITWFNLAPQALVVHMGGKKVPGELIAASNYAAWVVISVIVAWFLLGAS